MNTVDEIYLRCCNNDFGVSPGESGLQFAREITVADGIQTIFNTAHAPNSGYPVEVKINNTIQRTGYTQVAGVITFTVAPIALMNVVLKYSY